MFDFFRDLRKSDEDKRQEVIAAYLDGHLTPGERQRFEEKLATDLELRNEVDQLSLIKKNIQQLPQVRAPRNFTLDPALYGAPEPDSAVRLYPVLRTATVLVGIFFVIAVGAALLVPQSENMQSLALAPMAGEIADNTRNVIPESEQKFMEVPLEEAAASTVEMESLPEEEIVSEAEMAVEAPAPAEDLAAGTPSAENAIEPTIETGLAVDEALEEEAAAQEAVSEGAREESEAGLSAAAPITVEERQMTEEAVVAGGGGTEQASETPVLEQPGAEIPPAEPLPTASAPIMVTIPSATSPALAQVEPTNPAASTAVSQKVTQEEIPAEEQQNIDQDAGLEFGRILFPLLTILVLVLGIAVIVLSGATLFIRRKM